MAKRSYLKILSYDRNKQQQRHKLKLNHLVRFLTTAVCFNQKKNIQVEDKFRKHVRIFILKEEMWASGICFN